MRREAKPDLQYCAVCWGDNPPCPCCGGHKNVEYATCALCSGGTPRFRSKRHEALVFTCRLLYGHPKATTPEVIGAMWDKLGTPGMAEKLRAIMEEPTLRREYHLRAQAAIKQIYRK